MPHIFEREKTGVLLTFSGTVDDRELLGLQQKIQSSPDYDSIRYFIVDMLNVDEILYTVEDIEKIAALDKAASRSNDDVRLAFVCSSELITTLWLLYESEISEIGWQAEHFDDLHKARQWLNTPAPAAFTASTASGE